MTVEIRIQDDDSLEVSGKFDLIDEDGNAYGHHGKFACVDAVHQRQNRTATTLT